MTHKLIAGVKTTPKNSYLFKMLLTQLQACFEGRSGFTFFDTTGKISNYLLYTAYQRYGHDKNIWNKIHFIRLGETQYPCGLNLLAKVSAQNLSCIIADTVSLSRNGQHILDKALDGLKSQENKTRTILDVPMHFKINNLFAKVITNMAPETHDFIEERRDGIKDTQMAMLEVENAIQRIAGGSLKLHLGQRGFDLPIEKWLRDRHVVLFDLSTLDLTEQKFIENVLALTYLEAGYEVRDSHNIVFEDADMLQTKLAGLAIRESRKYGFDLTLSVDSIGNFDEKLQDDLALNIDRFTVFSQTPRSLRVLNKMLDFLPVNELLTLESNVAREVDRRTSRFETVHVESETFKAIDRETLEWVESREGMPRQAVHNEVTAYMASGEWD